MMMRTTNKTVFLLAILVFAMFTLKAQTQAQNIVQAKAAMQSLYKIYDSTSFITFDVRYNYNTDTVYGDFKKDKTIGSYTMSGKNAKFSMDGVEYMQNDSFFIAVYNKQKIIMVSNARLSNAGGYMPMRAAIDSILIAYANHYSITVQNNIANKDGYINFLRADSLAQFDNFRINFDTQRKFLTGIQYDYKEMTTLEQDQTDTANNLSVDASRVLHKKYLSVEFINYRFANIDASIYDENNYIWLDDGKLRPVKKYEGFRVYNNR